MTLRVPVASLMPALVLVACQASPGALSDAERSAVEDEAREAVTALMTDMNAHDAEAVLAHYEHSDDFSYAGVSDIRLGFEGFSQTIAPWYGTHLDVTFQYELVQVRALAADVALVVLRGSSSAAPSLVWTEVLKKSTDGRWLIVHEHESWPGASPPPPPHPM